MSSTNQYNNIFVLLPKLKSKWVLLMPLDSPSTRSNCMEIGCERICKKYRNNKTEKKRSMSSRSFYRAVSLWKKEYALKKRIRKFFLFTSFVCLQKGITVRVREIGYQPIERRGMPKWRQSTFHFGSADWRETGKHFNFNQLLSSCKRIIHSYLQ